MATINGTVTPFPAPPSTADPANFDTRADAFLGQFPTFETEMNGIIQEINAISITAIGYSQGYIDNTTSTLSFTFASDADDTLDTTENEYGYIIINDGVITTARNLIVDTRQRKIIIINNNTFDVTVKTLAGTGTLVLSGETLDVYVDGTNVVTNQIRTDLKNALTTNSFLHIQDQKTSGVGGGASTASSFTTRTLNTILTNSIEGASLLSNQITLPSGTYYIEFLVPCTSTGNTKARFRNITDNTSDIVGTSAFLNTGTDNASYCLGVGIIAIASSKVFEVQMYASNTYVNGFGRAVSSGEVEVYTDIKIHKVG